MQVQALQQPPQPPSQIPQQLPQQPPPQPQVLNFERFGGYTPEIAVGGGNRRAILRTETPLLDRALNRGTYHDHMEGSGEFTPRQTDGVLILTRVLSFGPTAQGLAQRQQEEAEARRLAENKRRWATHFRGSTSRYRLTFANSAFDHFADGAPTGDYMNGLLALNSGELEVSPPGPQGQGYDYQFTIVFDGRNTGRLPQGPRPANRENVMTLVGNVDIQGRTLHIFHFGPGR